MSSLKGTRTEQNLRDAFARESQANHGYLYFAIPARVGFDYEFQESPVVAQQKTTDAEGKVVDLLAGAFESYKAGDGNKGAKSDVS